VRKGYVIAGTACIVVAVALIAVLWVFWAPGPDRVETVGDIDRHFIEQMIPHHENAVLMAELALPESEHSELRELAANIRRDQSREIDQMRSWYRSWYGVDAPRNGERDDRLGRGMMGMGMMDEHTDLALLEAARPFEQEFIRQMVPHHRMAIMMAQMVLRGSERAEIRELARSIIEAQSREIEQMLDWYRDWYGE
jgi:uncharacterized protein (DUF305 family)